MSSQKQTDNPQRRHQKIRVGQKVHALLLIDRKVWLCLVTVLLALFPVISVYAKPAAPLSIYVSILPQSYLVERIGRPYVSVTTMVGPGKSPETYEPSPRQMAQLRNCQLYLRMAVPFENAWMHKLAEANPNMRIVDVSPHKHRNTQVSGIDPHTWTSPASLQEIARNIKDALTQLDPGHEATYNHNLQQMQQALQQLDQQIRTLLRESKITHFMVFHPAWGHYAQTYGLTQIAIEQNGKEPGARTIMQLIQQAKQFGLHRIFVQAQFNQRSVKIIAQAIHGKPVVVDPLAKDVITNLLHFTQLLTAQDRAAKATGTKDDA